MKLSSPVSDRLKSSARKEGFALRITEISWWALVDLLQLEWSLDPDSQHTSVPVSSAEFIALAREVGATAVLMGPAWRTSQDGLWNVSFRVELIPNLTLWAVRRTQLGMTPDRFLQELETRLGFNCGALIAKFQDRKCTKIQGTTIVRQPKH